MPTVGDYPDVLADMARAYPFLEIVEVPGCRTRGRPGFAPRGAMYHHTAGAREGGPFASLRICTLGRPDLRNSLCNTHRSRLHAGRVTLSVVSLNVCWHAGVGSWRGLAGNPLFWGLEAENDGIGEIWRAEELVGDRVALAAMLKCTPRPSADLLAGHREYALPPGRKVDPRNVDLNDARRAAQLLVDAGSTPGVVAHTHDVDDEEEVLAWA